MASENIRLYVSCHKKFPVPAHPFLIPVQVGAALHPDTKIYDVRDNEGENISGLNGAYCELTAQYWAWKNEEADFFGFFHYRRYLDFSEKALKGLKKRPYSIYALPDGETINKLGYSSEDLGKWISGYDVITPIPEDMQVSVYDHYRGAPFHRIKDLDAVLDIIKEKYPSYYASAAEYAENTKCYFGNIYIMKKEIFHDYCQWLFSILSEYDRRKNTDGYSVQELRVDGYLAERLFGMYFTFLKKTRPELKFAELPRVHFENLDGKNSSGMMKKKLIAALFPPGSKRRAVLKKIIRSKGAGR